MFLSLERIAVASSPKNEADLRQSLACDLASGWDDLRLVLCEALTKPGLLWLWFPSCPYWCQNCCVSCFPPQRRCQAHTDTAPSSPRHRFGYAAGPGAGIAPDCVISVDLI